MYCNEKPLIDKVWCIIPVFNNRTTVYDVAIGCRECLPRIVVVDDGSTDCNVSELFKDTDIMVLTHEINRGKGVAILTGAEFAREQGGTHIITIDADGQHNPADLNACMPLINDNDESIIIGVRRFADENITQITRIGRSVANFWMRIETGLVLKDCQSGFRVYPLQPFSRCHLNGKYYDFETEALVRLVWGGVRVKEVDIDVWYPVPEKRISHFHPCIDTLRISCMHIRLVGRRIFPLPHKRLVQKSAEMIDLHILRHPILLLKKLLMENANPCGLAVSAGVGIVLAVLPLISMHTIAIIYVTARLHLNKIMAVSIQHICMPPLVPLMCIELGYYMRHGCWLSDITMDAVFGNIPARLFDWFLGSLVLAPILAVVTGLIVYFSARIIQKKKVVCVGE